MGWDNKSTQSVRVNEAAKDRIFRRKAWAEMLGSSYVSTGI
jgi:hypothetical protein